MLDSQQELKLRDFSQALIDQHAARVIIEPQARRSGFWFGGGNMVEDDQGNLLLVGRYRNAGDSRTGVAAGERGLELAVFRSVDRGTTWTKLASWSKQELDVGSRRVLSIEGAALLLSDRGAELFVSTEKDGIGYPPGFKNYLKPGTGVWTIERIAAPNVEGLRDAAPVTILESRDPAHLHLKDPFIHVTAGGDVRLGFCSHPFSWTSSNTGYAVRRRHESGFDPPVFEFFPRGVAWDVAMTRGTCVLDLPRVGQLADAHLSLIFYDGGECVRNLDEHAAAVRRPRGYSCEELGGVGYFSDDRLDEIVRLSRVEPALVSPHGTGCSRYVDVLSTREGLYATWQQSQPDFSQPLVMNFVPHEQVEALLS
jgi:hypothetical protein